MPFSSLWQALIRFWYVTVLGALLTMGLGVAASMAVPATYQAEARILLIQKTLTGPSEGLNPYVAISGLTPFADVVARSMTDTAAAQSLQDQGATSEFSVARDLTTNGPVLLVTAANADPAAAVADLDLMVASASPVLAHLQADIGVSQEALVSVQVVTQDTEPATVRKAQIRAVVVAVAAGGFLTVMAAALLGRSAARKPARRLAGALLADGAAGGSRTARAASPADPPRVQDELHDAVGRRRRELAGRGARGSLD